MASSKIKVLKTGMTHNGFSVEYEVNGEIKGHSFPKESALLEKDEDGIPEYVNRLQEMEEDKEEKTEFSEANLKNFEGKEFNFSQRKLKKIRDLKQKKKNNNIKKKGDVYVKI